MVDMLTSAHTCEAQTAVFNPAYEVVKQGEEKEGAEGEQKGYEYEVMAGVSLGTNPHTMDETYMYEMPSPPSCQPFSCKPLSGDPPICGGVGVVREGEGENVYDTIPGDK